MKKDTSLLVLKVLAAVLAAAGLWLLARRSATPDGYAAVAGALHQARPADVESITLYPLLPDGQGRPARPFQLRGAVAIGPLLGAMQQLQPLPVAADALRPLVEATVVVRLRPALAAAWQLHSRAVIWRLATAAQGEVALRAYSPVVCQSTALNQRVRYLCDSLARRWAATP